MASLLAPDHFSPNDDAEALKKACKGWGTDENAIISNWDIEMQHRESIESELSGDFEKAVYRWILDPEDRDAVLAHVTIKKSECNYNVIIEIAAILSPVRAPFSKEGLPSSLQELLGGRLGCTHH